VNAVIWLSLYGVVTLVAVVGRLLELRASRPQEASVKKVGPSWWERL